MILTDYIITQTEKLLTTTSSIKLVKNENRVSRLVFRFDGTIPARTRLYCAFYNYKTNKYFYTPILYNGAEYYVIIGTEITFYPIKWSMLIIAVAPDMTIDSTTEIDDELIVWSSFEFKKIVVIDTFLKDEAVMLTHPNIEKALDDLMVLHDEVIDHSSLVSGDVTQAQSILAECQAILEEIRELAAEIKGGENSGI